MARFNENEKVLDMASNGGLKIIFNSAGILIYTPILFVMQPALAAIGLLFILAIAGLTIWSAPRVRAYEQHAFESGAARDSHIIEAVQGIETVKSLAQENDFSRKAQGFFSRDIQAALDSTRFDNKISLALEFLSQSSSFIILGIGASLVIEGSMTPGQLIAFVGILSQVSNPAKELADFYDEILEKIIDVKDDGSIHLNMKYFAFTHDKVMTNQKFSDLFGIEPRKESESPSQIHFDLGASAQKVLEDVLLKMANHIHIKTKMKNLCLGGGVALNGVANYRLLKESLFENIHIPPSPGDAGSAIGCAQYAFFVHQKQKRIIEQNHATRIRQNVYLGPSFDEDSITKFLDAKKIKYEKLSTQSLLEKTAKKISDGNIVGWYQGKMEWGPRALGNRSILADPRNSTMKDILNEKIKHRESFRPFAPSVLEEFSSDYFEIDIPSPYMLMVAKVKQPEKIPAVTHIDGTARLQTVSKESNPLYYELINQFYKITEIPIIINTSMNVMGEPIVNTPSDAYNMILKTDMDYLVLGNNFISR